jgi:hypothetical protein
MYLIARSKGWTQEICLVLLKLVALTSMTVLLAGCASLGTSIGISVPIGSIGGVGVSIGSGGIVSGSVGVGAGGGSVSVGASGQLPKQAEKKADAGTEKKDEKQLRGP